MGIELRQSDFELLNNKLSALNCEVAYQIIWGTLEFCCFYDSNTEELIHDSPDSNSISDSYEVKIDFKEDDVFGFPKVYETSGRIREYAETCDIELTDLHINKDEDDSCCLGIFPEYHWISAYHFIFYKVIPFFYWQSHLRIKGHEPWRAYSHGDPGIIEALRFPVNEVLKAHNRNLPCPCGSGVKYKKCCLSRDRILKTILSD